MGGMNRRVAVAGAWGLLFGALTCYVGPISSISDHAVLAYVQILLMCLMIPGLIVANGIGSLVPAVVINALIHFALCFFALRFVPAFKSKHARDIDAPFGS